jgi:hypothetical protein
VALLILGLQAASEQAKETDEEDLCFHLADFWKNIDIGNIEAWYDR